LIAQHLVEIETLTREDIEELVDTGRIQWWEKKKAKLAEQNASLNDATITEEDRNRNENEDNNENR